MKINKLIYIPILKAMILAILTVLVIVIVSTAQPAVLPVQAPLKIGINLNDDNLVSLVKSYTDTNFLHRLELVNGHIHVQLHFQNMTELVEHLNAQLDVQSSFYFQTANNVEYLTINVSEQTTHHIIYQIKITKLDYLAGKSIEIVPLNG